MRESRTYGSVRAKAEWLSYSTMLPVDAAATMAGVSSRTVYRWVVEDKVHYLETEEGQLRICSESLSKHKSEVRNQKSETAG